MIEWTMYKIIGKVAFPIIIFEILLTKKQIYTTGEEIIKLKNKQKNNICQLFDNLWLNIKYSKGILNE